MGVVAALDGGVDALGAIGKCDLPSAGEARSFVHVRPPHAAVDEVNVSGVGELGEYTADVSFRRLDLLENIGDGKAAFSAGFSTNSG